MSLFQVLATMAFGAALLRTVLALRSRTTGRRTAVAGILLWLLGILLVCFPNLTIPIARFLGIRRGVDAVLYTSVAVLAYAVFRLYIALEMQNRTITRLVSEIALRMPMDEPGEVRPTADQNQKTEK